MFLEDKLKNNHAIHILVKNYKIRREFKKDYLLFKNNYMENLKTSKQIEYKIMLLVHALEKGMCNKKLSPFGFKKINELMTLVEKANKRGYSLSEVSYQMAFNIIKKWSEIFKENNWTDNINYMNAKKFIDKYENRILVDNIIVGKTLYTEENYNKYFGFDYLDAISTRKSYRQFSPKELKKEDIEYCINSAILTPTACNRQMIKIYFVQNFEKKKILQEQIMGLSGFTTETTNLFLITFDISAFDFYGERNQGFLNAGLVAMNLCNAMHFKGIGSCFLQWGNSNKIEEKIKRELEIPVNEKIAISIGAGYYNGPINVPSSYRKKIDQIYKII